MITKQDTDRLLLMPKHVIGRNEQEESEAIIDFTKNYDFRLKLKATDNDDVYYFLLRI